MTIRTKVTRLTDKQAALLLKVGTIYALRDGIDITLYLSLEFLRNFLTKNNSRDILEIMDERDRQALLLVELVLQNFRGQWLDFEERIRVPDEVIQEIVDTHWLPSRRTFESWQQHWQLERFLEFRIVPLEYLLDRSGYSSPYSGYCKGYGEGGHPSRETTKYSAELDGVDTESSPPRINLLEIENYQRVLRTIEASKAKRIQDGNR